MREPRLRLTRFGSLIAIILSGALVLAACGGGGDDSDKSASSAKQGSGSAEQTPSSAPAPAPGAAPAAPQPGQAGLPAGSAPAQTPDTPAPAASGAAPKASTAPKAATPTPSSSSAAAPAPKTAAPSAPKTSSGASAAPSPAAPGPAPSGGGGGASDRGVTPSEITLGSVQMHGMPLGNLLVDPHVRALNAATASINDAGGVHGRKLNHVSCDDGPGETSRAKACMKKLVEQDKIFSLITSITWSSIAMTNDDIQRTQTPMVGAWAYGYTEWTNPWSFPTHMSMLNESNAGAEWVRDVIKPKSFGMICLNAPEMQKSCANVNRVLTQAGAKMVHKVDASLTPGDLSAEVIAMRSKNPDHIVHYVINPATIAKFVVDSAQQQYWPPKGISGNHLAAELLGEIFGDWPVGRYWTNTTYQLWGPEYMAAMRKYAPNNDGLNHHITQAGFVATNILAQALKEIGPEPTRQKLMQVLSTPGRVWDAGPGLDQKFQWAPNERFTPETAGRREFMYKYMDANTVANKDNSPHGFVPDPNKFVISDTQDCCYN